MKKYILLILLVIIALSIGALPTFAQDDDPPDPGSVEHRDAEPMPTLPPVRPPTPPIWNFDGLSIEYQRVDVSISDQIATTHIDQLFVNDNDWMLEGVYLFPLPQGAAVSQLTMWVNGVPIEAKILEADEARQIYDEIVRQLRDPALLEYVGSSAIQANVFPIPPHEERKIEIEYSQLLPAENGLVRYVYPQSTDLYTNTPLDNQNIRVEVQSNEAIRAIYSPSHPVSINRDGDFRAVVGYEAADVAADTDYELYYAVSPEDIGLSLLSYKEPGEDGFFLLLATPSVEVDAQEIVAKDVILVLDTSGSMQLSKLSQAQQAVAFVIQQLNPSDRFNIISFSTGTRAYARQLVSADEPGDYQSFIESLEAVGGTNISQALLEGVAQADGERPTTIIFLTDGLATEGVTDTPLLLETVKQQTPDNIRIFSFGVGNDVDTLLLDSLSQNHGGATTYVRPGQEIDEAISAFYAKVSTPVLANIDIDFGDIVAESLYPQELPDLFAGSQLILAGRYRQGGPTSITLSGEVNGEEQTFVYDDVSLRSNGGDDFIPRLWATRAIGNLLTQIRLHGEDQELVQSVVNLSLRYGIITPYTSYLIEEDDIFTQSGRDAVFEESMDALSMPAEVSGEKAVDLAEEQADMAAAEAPAAAPMPTMVARDGTIVSSQEVVQLVGSKTFVMRDGVWIDTAYDADNQTPQQITFAGEAYFELLSTYPELGQYLAMGPRILLVFEEMVIEVVESTGQGTQTLPDIQPADTASSVPTKVILDDNQDQEPQDEDGDKSVNEEDTASNVPCASAYLAPMLLIGPVVFIGRRPRFWK